MSAAQSNYSFKRTAATVCDHHAACGSRRLTQAVGLALSQTLGEVFRYCGYIAFAAAVLLTILPATSARGLVQRVTETVLFGAVAVATSKLYGGA